ncbi:hypothetical protein M8J76_008558 [Diaphorina citri]|nr:hypothetical protein M8J75_010592 [Diaphorina citri]KAI5736929.1 hypothetical protein M8J76_008558 [Diaphorina citri]KAI5744139.1 hypothetical protein M8J77_025976 [Diaphorina citri]
MAGCEVMDIRFTFSLTPGSRLPGSQKRSDDNPAAMIQLNAIRMGAWCMELGTIWVTTSGGHSIEKKDNKEEFNIANTDNNLILDFKT